MTDVLLVRARFGGFKIVLSREPRPSYLIKHNLDGNGKKSVGFVPYVTIGWGSATIDIIADFATVERFFFPREAKRSGQPA